MSALLDAITSHSLFRIVDFAFHLVVLWHLTSHVCNACRRLIRWSHRSLISPSECQTISRTSQEDQSLVECSTSNN